MSLLLNQPRVRSKLLQVGATSVLAGLAIMLPLQASYAQSQYIGLIANFCANTGATSKITSCADCHTGSNPSVGNATTANAQQYRTGNFAPFCIAAAPTPTPVPTAIPTPRVTATPAPTTIPTPMVTRPPVTPTPEMTPPPRPTPPPRRTREREDDSSRSGSHSSDSGRSSRLRSDD